LVGNGTYSALNATVFLRWEDDDSVMRYRYNFTDSGGAQL